MPNAQRLVVVSGLSGSGKTTALHALEDLGFYCIDNLPVSLLVQFAKLITASALPLYREVAIGIDARNPVEALWSFPSVLEEIRATELRSELIYIEASDETLLKRFSETRRKHPLSTGAMPLGAAIDRERELLEGIAEHADLRVDSSHTNIHQLRETVRVRVAQRPSATLSVQLMSFAFKHGVPPDADFVFDLRCLPNPHWEPALRELTGLDDGVIDFLSQAALVGEMIDDISSFLDRWMTRFEQDNRSYLTIALGCTGGRHRSVFSVERLANYFRAKNKSVLVSHREI